AGQEVTAELIGAQGMAERARGPQALREVALQRIDRRQPRRRRRGDDRQERDADAEPGFHARSLTRGSSQPYNTSTRRLIIVYVPEMTKTAARTTGKSRLRSACTVRRPSPGHAKIVSVMTAPPRSWPISSPASVTIGIAELCSVCLATTRGSLRPLARAVST